MWSDLSLLISSGDDIYKFNEDTRIYNELTGSRFENFFNIGGKVLHWNGNLETHSRCQPCNTDDKEAGGVTYIPPCVLIRDLHEKAENQCLEEYGTSEDVL